MRVDESLPQLHQLLWNRTMPEVTEQEAFELYELHRAWVDPATTTPHERRFFEAVVARHGGGVFLG